MLMILTLMVAGSLLIEASGAVTAPADAGRTQDDDVYAVRGSNVSAYATAAEARADATNVLEVAVDHVGVPWGLTGGNCHVTGQVVRVVRGAGLTPRGRIELAVPCVARPVPGRPRRIPEDAFAEGSSSLFYFSARQELLDVERLGE